MKLISHPDYIKHKQTEWHPESPQRLIKIQQRLRNEGLFEDVATPKKCEYEALLAVHDKNI